jgi:hypothetical protein
VPMSDSRNPKTNRGTGAGAPPLTQGGLPGAEARRVGRRVGLSPPNSVCQCLMVSQCGLRGVATRSRSRRRTVLSQCQPHQRCHEIAKPPTNRIAATSRSRRRTVWPRLREPPMNTVIPDAAQRRSGIQFLPPKVTRSPRCVGRCQDRERHG